jgi:hypothetical protein
MFVDARASEKSGETKMLQPHHLLTVVPISPPGVHFALRLVGEMRIELDQLHSLLDSAIDRAEDAAAIDSPERRQALDLGRIARELLAENSRRLGEVEAGVRAVTFGP